ncbi:unnamed protein product [Mytilus edulis]|uniref:Uncharacterized protein n=1 Tax=Mytilus edulis TaxID=6550 RepID=A0A8S3V956_MYTED|nr:unnamed protein product [Mytilus edulis]
MGREWDPKMKEVEINNRLDKLKERHRNQEVTTVEFGDAASHLLHDQDACWPNPCLEDTCVIVYGGLPICIPFEKSEYIGCFSDDGDRHFKYAHKYFGNSMSLAACRTHCGAHGYRFAGLQITVQQAKVADRRPEGNPAAINGLFKTVEDITASRFGVFKDDQNYVNHCALKSS